MDCNRYKGQTFIVTGGANGIGFGIANRLFAEGAAHGALIDVNEDALKAAVAVHDLSHVLSFVKNPFLFASEIQGHGIHRFVPGDTHPAARDSAYPSSLGRCVT